MAAGKPVIASRQALRDIDAAVDHYLAEADTDVALRFIDAAEAAFRRIALQPGIGSPRYALELQIPGLRSWLLSGFPHLIFYLERDDRVEVVRVLHGARDIPPKLTAPEPE